MFWKKNKDDKEYMQHVKMATLYRCDRILQLDIPKKIEWNENVRKEPVYVDGNTAISLINGEEYSILKHSFMDTVQDISQIKIGIYQVVSLDPLYCSSKVSEMLYREAKEIYNAKKENVNVKKKAYL